LGGLQKIEQWAKKCIERRGEYVEEIPNLVVVACFIPGRANDLLAPPRIVGGQILTVLVDLGILIVEASS